MESQNVKNEKARLVSLDLLKLLAIYLVLWGHCVQQFLTAPAVDNCVYSTIYSFHMSLFMVLSGYFSGSSLSVDFHEFVRKRGLRLLLPVLSWSVLVFVMYTLCDALFPVLSLGKGDLSANLRASFECFWFLKSLFVCYALAWFGKRLNLAVCYWVLLTIAVSQLFPLWNVKIMYPCFLVGMLLSESSHYVRKYGNGIMVVSGCLYLFLMLFWSGDFLRPADLFGALRNGDVQSVFYQLYVRLYRIATGLSGSVALFVLFDKLFVSGERGAVAGLARWGRYTLEVYMLQTVVLEILMARFLCFDSLPVALFGFLLAPILSLAVLAVLFCVIRVIYRSRFLSLVLFANGR
jgi:fucose 4-O-acetylase-like acetyltransferase